MLLMQIHVMTLVEWMWLGRYGYFYLAIFLLVDVHFMVEALKQNLNCVPSNIFMVIHTVISRCTRSLFLFFLFIYLFVFISSHLLEDHGTSGIHKN